MARLIEPDKARGYTFSPPPSRFTEREVALYALATGAVSDPLDDRQLRRVYEGHAGGFTPLPGFYAVLALGALLEGLRRGDTTPGLHYGLERVLHAEQTMTFGGPLPRTGELVHRGIIRDVFDKGRHALVVTSVESSDAASGFSLSSEITSLVRSAGGFGGPRGEERPDPVPADRAPDFSIEQATRRDQALLFRLLGDDNPLHADPRAARTFGLKEPILHGMCTLGFATRHVIDTAGEGNADALRFMSVRFSDMVIPGETLVTDIWRLASGEVAFRVRIKERDRIAISHGTARFGPVAIEAVKDQRGAGAPSPNVAAPVATGDDAALVDAIERVLNDAGAYLAARPALVRAVGAKFQFVLRAPDLAFVVDLTRSPGVVRRALEKDADCKLSTSAIDFLRLARGEILGKALYLTGALEMTGRTELASHLDFLREVSTKSAGSADAPNVSFEADVARLGARVAAGAVAARPVVVELHVESRGDVTVVLDGAPRVTAGRSERCDAVVSLAPQAFDALVTGTRTLRALYMFGAARVRGDASAARVLDETLSGATAPREE